MAHFSSSFCNDLFQREGFGWIDCVYLRCNNLLVMAEATISAEMATMAKENIASMDVERGGFDVIMVCCSSQLQANYWQKRLEAGRGSVLAKTSIVLAVQEDWPGGAGNALGTLYAYKNAAKLALDSHGMDIDADLRAGKISIGLYNTAGKGTRLAPLPGAENNNKPGVKLPASVLIDNEQKPITILEAVIKQTGCYAKSRMGRLSVFWGDQVFIPTVPVAYQVTHHADILCSLGPMLSETEWKAKGMEKYGLIALAAGGAAQVEKVDHATAVKLLASLGEIKSVGASLGSFSVSSHLLFALLSEFAQELDTKNGKLDSDPHLWMPMTLERAPYLQLMSQKGIEGDVAGAHFDRIQVMMTKFHKDEGVIAAGLGLFGPVDVGQSVLWWDYGQLPLYQKNTLMMTHTTEESALMRTFFGLQEGSSRVVDSQVDHRVTVDELSCVSSSTIGSGSVKGYVSWGCARYVIPLLHVIPL